MYSTAASQSRSVGGSYWLLADIRQSEKSLSLYRPFRFLNFQRFHRQQATQTSLLQQLLD